MIDSFCFLGPDSQQVILEVLSLHCAAESRSHASRAISNPQPMLRDTPRGETLLAFALQSRTGAG